MVNPWIGRTIMRPKILACMQFARVQWLTLFIANILLIGIAQSQARFYNGKLVARPIRGGDMTQKPITLSDIGRLGMAVVVVAGVVVGVCGWKALDAAHTLLCASCRAKRLARPE
jgi:hypothetical protein